MNAIFRMEKETKNMIRFEEVLESEYSAPIIGPIYIPKYTLGKLGWKESNLLRLEVEIGGSVNEQ